MVVRAPKRSKAAAPTGSPSGAGRHTHRQSQPLSLFCRSLAANPRKLSSCRCFESPCSGFRKTQLLSLFCATWCRIRKLSFSHCFGSRPGGFVARPRFPFSENSAFITVFRTRSNLQFSFCNSLPSLPLSTLICFYLPYSTLFCSRPAPAPFLALGFHDNLSPYAKSTRKPPHTRGARRPGPDLSSPAESRLLPLPRHSRQHDRLHIRGRPVGSVDRRRRRAQVDHASQRRDSPRVFAGWQDNRLLGQLRRADRSLHDER